MSKDDIINNIPQCPGIYMIQNDINKKCYIGQSINLHKRLLHHINNSVNNRYNAPIYKAFKKYGIDSFSLYILKTFDNYITSDIKQQLDTLEKQYIRKYNSYGATGYNQTKGGDGGIDGYKFTDEQKLTVQKKSYEKQNDGRHTIYCYDINTKNIVSSTSLQQLKRDMNVNFTRGSVSNLLVKKRYILSRDKQELMQKISKYNEKIQLFNSNGCSKLTVDMKNDIVNNISETDFLTKYNVCKSTYYHYKQKLSDYIK